MKIICRLLWLCHKRKNNKWQHVNVFLTEYVIVGRRLRTRVKLKVELRSDQYYQKSIISLHWEGAGCLFISDLNTNRNMHKTRRKRQPVIIFIYAAVLESRRACQYVQQYAGYQHINLKYLLDITGQIYADNSLHMILFG